VKVAFQTAGEGKAVERRIMVPKTAVRQRDGRDVVWLVRNGRIEPRGVAVSATQGDEVTIAAGLNGGERVVLDGAANLSEGARVTEAKE